MPPAPSKPVKITWRGQVTKEIVTGFRDAVEECCAKIATDAKKNTHNFSDTGNLAAQIKWGVSREGGRIVAKVFTTTGSGGARGRDSSGRYKAASERTGYALWVEVGTGIYGKRKQPIKPKRGKFLVWRDKKTGKLIFARQVKGRPATPFFRPAIESNRGFVQARMKETLRKLPK